jgi:two-component system, OmpR family, phosphate regulon response regulator PhoB
MASSEGGTRAARTILVVDDDRLVLEHLEMTLKDSGYSVTVCEDGEAALYLVPSLNPDVIILDSVMPGMGGPEVLRHLKAEKASATIPVMMLTAKTGRDSVEEAVKLGAEDYLAKPIDPGKLLARVEKLLEKSSRKKNAEGMEWKAPSREFDLPLKGGPSRVRIDPDKK